MIGCSIYEMPVYDGAMKHWRILCLKTGTVYSSNFDTQEECRSAIEDGDSRGDLLVKRVNLIDANVALDQFFGLDVR